MKKLLVLGVGNLLLSDEGVGIYAIQEFLKEDTWTDKDVDFIDGGTFTQDIFFLFQNYEKLLVLDAIRGGQKPGTIYKLAEENLRHDERQAISLHDIDLLDSLKMCELMGHKPELHVLGIEPLDITTWNMELTPDIKDSFPFFMKQARQEITDLLHA